MKVLIEKYKDFNFGVDVVITPFKWELDYFVGKHENSYHAAFAVGPLSFGFRFGADEIVDLEEYFAEDD